MFPILIGVAFFGGVLGGSALLDAAGWKLAGEEKLKFLGDEFRLRQKLGAFLEFDARLRASYFMKELEVGFAALRAGRRPENNSGIDYFEHAALDDGYMTILSEKKGVAKDKLVALYLDMDKDVMAVLYPKGAAS